MVVEPRGRKMKKQEQGHAARSLPLPQRKKKGHEKEEMPCRKHQGTLESNEAEENTEASTEAGSCDPSPASIAFVQRILFFRETS